MSNNRHDPPHWTEQDRAASPVWEGFDREDLGPLADYLRTGQPLGPLAEQLAAFIDAGAIGFLDPPKLAGRPKLPRGLVVEVGAYVFVRERLSPRGWQKRNLAAAAERFSNRHVTERTARAALSQFSADWADLSLRFEMMPALGAATREFCAEVSRDYEEAIAELLFAENR